MLPAKIHKQRKATAVVGKRAAARGRTQQQIVPRKPDHREGNGEKASQEGSRSLDCEEADAQLQRENRIYLAALESRERLTPKASAARLITPPDTPPEGRIARPRARSAVSQNDNSDLQPIDEPLTASEALAGTAVYDVDEELCRSIQALREDIVAFAFTLPPLTGGFSDEIMDEFLSTNKAFALNFIGSIARGGYGGADGRLGWRALLGDQPCRQALVVGIVGRTLQEHVFGASWFGATTGQLEILDEIDEVQGTRDGNGFDRCEERSHHCRDFASQTDDDCMNTLHNAKTLLTAQVVGLLAPLWNAGTTAKGLSHYEVQSIFHIISTAADISRSMRCSRDTVYHWPTTFKDEEWAAKDMEALNLAEIIATSPYERSDDGYGRAVLRPGSDLRSQAIVRIVCFPSLVAYRQYGGSIYEQEVATGTYRAGTQGRGGGGEEENPGQTGFRTRVICKSLVLLQWGQQRTLTKEAGTSIHADTIKKGRAAYINRYVMRDGYEMDLWDLYEEKMKS